MFGKWGKFGLLQLPFCILAFVLALSRRHPRSVVLPASYEQDEPLETPVQPIWHMYLGGYL